MPEKDLDILRHSSAHLLAHAVKDLYPDVKLAIGPSIANGFYYDFDREIPFVAADLDKIDKRMRKIAKRNSPIIRKELSQEEAAKFFLAKGETYKLELIADIVDAPISTYTQDDFTDLCAGPHLESTGQIKHFKLLSVAGSYWRGDEKNRMLQRIYGTAFYTAEELEAYLNRLEEAKQRDHRKLGQELDLFSVDEAIGPGLIQWHPNGAMIRHIIETFWRDKHYKSGYKIVYSPHIAKSDLWKISGHLGFYKDNMFSPIEVEGSEYILKPMNCPFHIMMFKNSLRSYRELPLRWAELGTVYRYEKSGVLHGLLRVRGFTQDDAHIFCMEEQLRGEIGRVVDFTIAMLRAFGFDKFQAFLSTRPEKYVGELAQWDKATEALRGALEDAKVDYEVDEGEGVFYGPKIDIKIKDSLDRMWQCSTIQVDFNLPDRFEMEYVGEDGNRHRPVMIHRALLGSLERFFGCLIEHHAGAFPLWLSPVQVKILTITNRQDDYARKIEETLLGEGIRVESDFRNEKIGFKIRNARMERVPYMLIIGEQEETSGLIAVKKRGGEDVGTISPEAFLAMIKEELQPPTPLC
ncbi:MAG: threonine--tRNA ligase [Nitrospinae bacterium]|nr:threonine--tRNA ligase [Nitrospinota bacterium]